MLKQKSARRDFIKKAAYAMPAILTLKALPAFAASGSKAAKSFTRSRRSRPEQDSKPNP